MEGKLIEGFEGLDVGDRLRVQLPHFSPLPRGKGRSPARHSALANGAVRGRKISDVERGFIDFAQQDEPACR